MMLKSKLLVVMSTQHSFLKRRGTKSYIKYECDGKSSFINIWKVDESLESKAGSFKWELEVFYKYNWTASRLCLARAGIGTLKLIEIHMRTNLHFELIPERKWKGKKHGLWIVARQTFSTFYYWLWSARKHILHNPSTTFQLFLNSSYGIQRHHSETK